MLPHPATIPTDQTAIYQGDCLDLIPRLPDESVDIAITSPPYWGQREATKEGSGNEEDPRDYLAFLRNVFCGLLPKLKPRGILWLNIGDAYNSSVSWGVNDASYVYSTLGRDHKGHASTNAAYVKPRHSRQPFTDANIPWLSLGNLLMLPQRLVLDLVDAGYFYRGEVIWSKKSAMPEGRCRRPHRKHESIFLLARRTDHHFRIHPPVPSLWEMFRDRVDGLAHHSRFPVDLPRRCIDAYGESGKGILVLDPFSGSGTTGVAAQEYGCSYIGFEIDPQQARASEKRLAAQTRPLIDLDGLMDTPTPQTLQNRLV